MEAFANQTEGFRLLRIDVADWGSPVARQYGIQQLPTVWRYDGTALVTQDTNAALSNLPAPQ